MHYTFDLKFSKEHLVECIYKLSTLVRYYLFRAPKRLIIRSNIAEKVQMAVLFGIPFASAHRVRYSVKTMIYEFPSTCIYRTNQIYSPLGETSIWYIHRMQLGWAFLYLILLLTLLTAIDLRKNIIVHPFPPVSLRNLCGRGTNTEVTTTRLRPMHCSNNSFSVNHFGDFSNTVRS